MSLSTATVTPTNIALSPMRVKFNGVDLGGTADKVKMAIKYDTADVMVDQFGKSIIDKRVSGLSFEISLTLSEIKNKDNWKVAFPTMKEIVNGGTKTIYADMEIGDSLLASSHQLLLHPLENADADLSEDYLFYKAASIEASEVEYGPEKQVGLNVKFIVFPDTGTIPARYMYHGDPSNGLVAATAGSATPGANTGNGTVDTIAVSSGVTKTETITILCVGQTTGNDFFVSGSVSGALGEAHVGSVSGNTVNFTVTSGSPAVISFTIHQGTVQFAKGDSFTIATVAANYS